MSRTVPVRARKFHERDNTAYVRTDNADASNRFEDKTDKTLMVRQIREMVNKTSSQTVPKGRILFKLGKWLIVVANGTQMNRDMSQVMQGGLNKTYMFPSTTTTVTDNAFRENKVVSVRFNEGLKVLGDDSFSRSEIRKLVLPSSVKSVGNGAFY